MTDIVDGDSGSWVVNETTSEVLGHVVAADNLGGAYIMPLEATLSEIKNRLQAQSVGLASTVDILNAAKGNTSQTAATSYTERFENAEQQSESRPTESHGLTATPGYHHDFVTNHQHITESSSKVR